MRKSLFLISLALSSAACSQSADEAPASEESALSPAASATAVTKSDAGVEAKAFEFEDDASRNGGTREFAYSWPAAAAREPKLAAQLDAERVRELEAQKADWEKSLVDFPDGCVSCIGRGFDKEWKVVADLPQWLSLSADLYLYTGGAHGMSGKTSLVWDRRGEVGVKGVELFKSPVALETALGVRLCDALNVAREKRRGMKIDPTSGDMFDDCPGIDESAVLVGSSNGETFDRIGIYFGPYVAGSYAEGAYELNFPVTASIIDAVKPQYANAFSVKR
ncbi:PdaC/SigV domain-containing protein [Qipengyuania sphaerica]|uniref:PdaC/SigV domain-containing protein n=1 Tax=Qipengyuania sphaerica TaxID=2867243 RepID=UPI001C88509F|nr:DUF4163 domain-containing protein [Qipengyuania sphaerica]MBX7540005.1 hypothetical protein [Qipengyuania sphaerica]